MPAFNTWFPTSLLGGVALNIKSYGALGTGAGSAIVDALAWHALADATDGIGRVVRLQIPPGDYRANDGTGEPLFVPTVGVVPGWVIEAYGAKLRIAQFMATENIPFSSPQPRIQTALAGATTVTLVTAADSSNYAVGQWVCLSCIDLQDGGSYPPNAFIYEFRKIEEIDAGPGVITLDAPLRYTYKSTYPVLDSPTGPFPDQGGSATLYPMALGWDTDVVLRGGTEESAEDRFGGARKITFEDWTFLNHSPALAVSKHLTYRRCNGPGTLMEVDKFIEHLEFDSSNWRQVRIQSSNDRCSIKGSEIAILTGTMKHQSVVSSSIGQLIVGPIGYGICESLLVQDSQISSLTIPIRYCAISAFTAYAGDGLLRINIAAISFQELLAIGALVPGGHYFISTNGGNYGCPFQVLDVYQDGNDAVYVTTLPEVLPAPNILGGAAADTIWPHPCYSVTVLNSDGCLAVRSMSKGPQGIPLYSYYNSDSLAGPDLRLDTQVPLWGTATKITINVRKAYTGALATLKWYPFGQFGALVFASAFHTGDSAKYTPKIDLKTAGKREIVIDGTTSLSGADADLDYDSQWFVDGMTHWLTSDGTNAADISGEDSSVWPIAELEVQTAQ